MMMVRMRMRMRMMPVKSLEQWKTTLLAVYLLGSTVEERRP